MDKLDREHPCLACGAPWRIEMKRVQGFGSAAQWIPGLSDCSNECWRVDPDRHAQGVKDRRAQGWA